MNPLVVDKISKKFICDKDSGFLYTRQLIASLPTDWRFTVLVPKNFDRNFFDAEHIIECIEYDYSTSIHQNRYHFNRNILAKALPYGVDIDVVLNMQPEVTANLRVFFENQRREKPIIINYFHWIDCKESRKYGEGGFINRQAEGFNDASLNLFHNEYAEKLFLTSCNENKLHLNDIKTGYFHPNPTTYGTTPIETPDKYVIFNHRCNNTTGWKEIIDIWNTTDIGEYKLWLTDESNLKEIKSLKEKNIIVQSIPFDSYGFVLNKAHFTICNLQEYATWNMAVLDSINHGTDVVANNNPLMSTFGIKSNSHLKQEIQGRLKESKITPEKLSIPDYNLIAFIQEAIQTRITGKHPHKIEEVKSYITRTEKRDFVNKFWSFHANSNFQIIRWILLSSGFTDNTNNTLTEYTKTLNH